MRNIVTLHSSSSLGTTKKPEGCGAGARPSSKVRPSVLAAPRPANRLWGRGREGCRGFPGFRSSGLGSAPPVSLNPVSHTLGRLSCAGVSPGQGGEAPGCLGPGAEGFLDGGPGPGPGSVWAFLGRMTGPPRQLPGVASLGERRRGRGDMSSWWWCNMWIFGA